MQHFLSTFLYVIAALIPMVNPLSGSIFFLSLTSDLGPRERAWLAARVAIYSFILNFFGISIDVLRVAGGLVLASAGWKAISSFGGGEKKSESRGSDEPLEKEHFEQRAFFPLTLPLMVGPGAMSVCTAIGTTLPTTFANTLGLNLASAALCIGIWVCFRYAGQISKRLGAAGADAIVKVFSFILICIGIQVLWAGFSGLWTELARTSLAFLAK